MGFFDFLSAPRQDPKKILMEKGGTLTPEGETFMGERQPDSFVPPEEQDQPFAQEASKATSTPPSPQAPDASEKADKLSREIAKLAAQISYGHSGDLENPQPYHPMMQGALYKRDTNSLESKFFQNPEDAAQTLVDSQNPEAKERIKTDPRMKRLNALIVEYKQTLRSEPGQRYVAGMKPPVGDQDIADAAGHLERLSERKSTLQSTLLDAASTAHAEELRKKIKDIEAAEEIGAKKLADLQSTQSIQSKEKGRPTANPADIASGDIKRGFASAGVSQKETANAVNDGIKAVAQSMGADFNPGDAVSFQYALPYAIQAIGPEAQLAFSEWMRDIKKKEAEAKGFTPTGNPAQDAGGMAGEKSEGPSHQDQIRANFEQQRLTRAEFAAAQELQSWPAIIAFVVLGMLIGPQGAFAFFSNARKKRELQGWLQQLEMERKYLLDEEDYKRQLDSDNRKMAAARLQKKEDTQEQWRHQVGMKLLDHKLIIERNAKKGNPETAVMKKLSSAFQRATGLAAKYSGEMQNEFAPEEKRASARANFNFYMKKAAELDMQLDEMGGEALQEEPVEE